MKQPTDSKVAFSAEHVIQRSISHGFLNTLTVKRVVCQDCNQFFGQHLDLIVTRNILQAVVKFLYPGLSRRSDEVLVDCDFPFRIACPGHPILNGSMAILKCIGNQFSIDLVPQIALERRDGRGWKYVTRKKMNWLRHDEKYTGRAVVVAASPTITRLARKLEDRGGIVSELRCRPKDQKLSDLLRQSLDSVLRRTIAKIAFNYLAWTMLRVSEQPLFQSDFDELRNFVRFAMLSEGLIVHPCPDFEESDEQRTNAEHYIRILEPDSASFPDGLVAELNLFRIMPWRVRLSKSYLGQDLYFPLRTEHVWDSAKGICVETLRYGGERNQNYPSDNENCFATSWDNRRLQANVL
jgi:hypothetical protein